MTLLGKAINDRLKEKRMNEERAKKLNELYWKQDDLYAQLVELIGDNEVTIFNIKKAFIDDGWVQWPVGGQDPRIMLKKLETGEATFKGKPLMTGQEFYDRFKLQLAAHPMAEGKYTVYDLARKAAGIE